MELCELNPFIRYARTQKNINPSRQQESVCYDCRVFYFENISGTIFIGQKQYELEDKTAVYLPPETAYRFRVFLGENARIIVLNFDLTQENEKLNDSLGTASVQNFNPAKVPFYTLPEQLSQPIIKHIPHAEGTLMQCVGNFLQRPPFYRESASAILKLFLLDLIKNTTMNGHTDICKVILSYVHDHFSDPGLTNKTIAEHFNYHPDYLSNLIRIKTGQPLHRYLINYRLTIAKNYLLATDYDIAEIAWRCGFCTDAYFIKSFHKATGTTPYTYRKALLRNEL